MSNIILYNVFPTSVGMNHHQQIQGITIVRVPHIRGDEPLVTRWLSRARAALTAAVSMSIGIAVIYAILKIELLEVRHECCY